MASGDTGRRQMEEGQHPAIARQRESVRQALQVDTMLDITDLRREQLLAIRKSILDSAGLQAELKARFNYPGVEWYWELPILGIDYAAAVPLLKYWLDRIENPDVKIEIASLLAFPEYDAAPNIARALMEVAASEPEPARLYVHDADLQSLSQFLISATAKHDRGSLYQFASDPSLPYTSRFFFLEAMTKAKDRRTIPLLEAALEANRATGAPRDLLRLLEKFNPDGFRSLVDSFQDHEDKEVRNVVAKIRIRLDRKAMKETAKGLPKPS